MIKSTQTSHSVICFLLPTRPILKRTYMQKNTIDNHKVFQQCLFKSLVHIQHKLSIQRYHHISNARAPISHQHIYIYPSFPLELTLSLSSNPKFPPPCHTPKVQKYRISECIWSYANESVWYHIITTITKRPSWVKNPQKFVHADLLFYIQTQILCAVIA